MRIEREYIYRALLKLSRRIQIYLRDVAACWGSLVGLTEEVKNPGCGRRLSLASWTVLILSTSCGGQQRAGCPHTDRALNPRAEAEPPNAKVTRSCVTAPNESAPLLHRSSCRQFAGCVGGGEGNRGWGRKLDWEKLTRVKSLSSHRPTSLNSASGWWESAFAWAWSLAIWCLYEYPPTASSPHCWAWTVHGWPLLGWDLPSHSWLLLFSFFWCLTCIWILSFCWTRLCPWLNLWEGSGSELVLISSLLLACPRSMPQGHSSTSTLHSSTWKPNFSVTWEDKRENGYNFPDNKAASGQALK